MTFSLTILGCSSALPGPNRNTSAQVISLDDRVYLIDCGEGTQVQLRKFHIRFQKIQQVFISHLHGDHFFGLIGLLSTYSLLGRTSGLQIFGPPALKEIIELQIELTGMEMPYLLEFHPIQPELHSMIFEDDHIQVFTLPMIHRIPTCGFLFREKPRPLKVRKEFLEGKSVPFEEIRKIKGGGDFMDDDGRLYPNAEITLPPVKPITYAYCTDTAYNEALIPLIRGADLLYHEATFMQDHLPRAEERYHSTAAQAGRIAALAGIGKLIIGHYSNRYSDLNPLLQEAKSFFSDVDLAEDGKCFEIRR